MKFAIPEISWHNKDPVLSVDFQPKTDDNGPLRLATGGTDTHVLIWYISTTDSGSVNLEVAADLTRHQKAVNVVRWAPSGQLLASGDDDSFIFIWKQKTDKDSAPQNNLEGEEQYKETWVIHKTLRGHMEDVLDLSWSSDSLFLASGSVDNKLLLWDVTKGKYSCILTDHKGFVQGVAWDPLGQYVATASSDRTFRTFDIASKKVVSRSSKAVLPFPPGHSLHDTKVRLYHDDTLQTFYRRLQWSPDGLLVAVPAGRVEPDQGRGGRPLNAVYIYTRYSLKVPWCVVPCGEPALCARWAARPLRPRAPGPPPALPLPRRWLLAVGTRRALLLYDTQQKAPLALISNIHYTRITDLSWSSDGRVLVASSTDGFCSVVTFARGELGDPAPRAPGHSAAEPMDVEPEPADAKETEPPKENPETKSTTPKIDSFIKFKAPAKSRTKTDPQPKTPLKIDVYEEVAMPSWSDDSNNDVIRPKENNMEVDKRDEIMVIEDSEDIKLVYEETQDQPSTGGSRTEDQRSTGGSRTEDQRSTGGSRTEDQRSTGSPKRSPRNSSFDRSSSASQNSFLRQAKVTDVKTMPAQSVPSPKAPRRVNFVTLSSPKNKKI